MGIDSPHAFNAADVADAVFSSMMMRKEGKAGHDAAHGEHLAIECLIASIDDGLKAAGLSFAEYLERIRHTRAASSGDAGRRWRFSARERAVQRVDHAVAHLCALMHPEALDS